MGDSSDKEGEAARGDEEEGDETTRGDDVARAAGRVGVIL